MIFEFHLTGRSYPAPLELKPFKWIKKRDDLISVFAFNEKERERVIKRLGKRYNLSEFRVERGEIVESEFTTFTIADLRFTNGRKFSPNDIYVSARESFGFDHPATILMLESLNKWRHSFVDKRAIDVGCGSGILSLFLLRIGCRKVYGIDIDPFVIEEARRNARKNGFRKRKLTFLLKDLSCFKEKFDLIVANVPINVHFLISDEVKRLLKKGGFFLAGGIFHEKLAEISNIYEPLCVCDMDKKEEWATIFFQNE